MYHLKSFSIQFFWKITAKLVCLLTVFKSLIDERFYFQKLFFLSKLNYKQKAILYLFVCLTHFVWSKFQRAHNLVSSILQKIECKLELHAKFCSIEYCQPHSSF